MGARREARECALMILYQMDLSGVGPEVAVERFFSSFGESARAEDLDPPAPYEPRPQIDAVPLTPQAKAYATRLVEGVARIRERLDGEIQRVSSHWRLDRMARVDRNILRLGAYELLELSEEVPRKVAINEAVEIAKRFGTIESSAFINGILDRLSSKPDKASAPAPADSEEE